MTRSKMLSLSMAGTAILAAPAAHAAGTRSEAALPAAAKAQAAAPAAAQPQGPKNGFPNSPGLERAREVANENARFLRSDSQG